MASTEVSNLACSVCQIAIPQRFCVCHQPPNFFCESCVSKHANHFLLPFCTYKFIKEPGYVREYGSRTGIQYEIAKSSLIDNIREVDRWKDSLQGETAKLISMLQDREGRLSLLLDYIRNSLDTSINFGLRERDESVHLPNPILRNSIAQGLYECKVMKLLTCQTDFTELSRQIEELISLSPIILQAEFPGIISIEKEENSERPLLVVTEKSMIVGATKAGETENQSVYIGQQGKNQMRQGYGKLIEADGSSTEGVWNKNQLQGKGKMCKADGSFYVGKQEGRNERAKETLGGWKRIGFILVVFFAAIYVARPKTSMQYPHCPKCPESECPSCPEVECPKCSNSEDIIATDICELWFRKTVKIALGSYSGQWNAQRQMEGFGKMLYSNGDVYEGQWMNNLRHGLGKLTISSGEQVEGVWSKDLVHGFATKKFIDGSVLTGHWTKGKLAGFGVVNTTDSVSFGEFAEGALHGNGCRLRRNGDVYAGKWVQGQKEGEGVEYVNGTLCHGAYKEGVKNGNATCSQANGRMFSGGWKNGVKSGAGTRYYPAEFLQGQWLNGSRLSADYKFEQLYRADYLIASNLVNVIQNKSEVTTLASNAKEKRTLLGAVPVPEFETSLTSLDSVKTLEGTYQGQWSIEGNRHGFGVQKYASGGIYEGKWVKDKRHGKGRMIYEDGSVYDGYWVDGEYEGFGVLTDSSNDRYEGLWVKGKKEGIGKETLPTHKLRFIGEFYWDGRSGWGFEYIFGGEYSAGWWNQGLISSGIEYKNNSFYYGTHKNGLKSGSGIFLSQDNYLYFGNWSLGQKHGYGFEYYLTDAISGWWKSDQKIDVAYFPQEKNRCKILQAKYGLEVLESSELHLSSQAKTTRATLPSISNEEADPPFCSLNPVQLSSGVYKGDWNEHGHRHGFGVQIFTDGSSYEGQWKEDVPHGRGRVISKNGDFYEGEVRNGLWYGTGFWRSTDNRTLWYGNHHCFASVTKQYSFGKNLSTKKWSFDGEKVDAVTFKPSKSILLTGVRLSKGVIENKLTLQVLEGSSTRGTVLYSQPEDIHTSREQPGSIFFSRKIPVTAHSEYTLKAVLLGQGEYFSKVQSIEQAGLRIELFTAEFIAGDRDNGSGPASSVFFELYYEDDYK